MPLFGAIMDEWARGKSATNYATMTIQSLCLGVTLILISIQMYHVYQKRRLLHSNWKLSLFLLTQLSMMCISFFYMFMNLWNYIYLHFPTNPLDCHAWFGLLFTPFALSRIWLITFLMLRSTLTFSNTFFSIPLKITIAIIVVTAVGNLTFIVIVVDSEPLNPVPGTGWCWRKFTRFGEIWSSIYHIFNSLMSVVALVVFYWKSRSVKRMVQQWRVEKKMNSQRIELDREFTKHIKLGMITIWGTVFVFFVLELFTVLVGISLALDQTLNNVLTFLMFKDNEFIYKWLVCNCNCDCECITNKNVEKKLESSMEIQQTNEIIDSKNSKSSKKDSDHQAAFNTVVIT